MKKINIDNFNQNEKKIYFEYKKYVNLFIFKLLSDNNNLKTIKERFVSEHLIEEEDFIVYETIIKLNEKDLKDTITSKKIISFLSSEYNLKLDDYFKNLWEKVKNIPNKDTISIENINIELEDSYKKLSLINHLKDVNDNYSKKSYSDIIKDLENSVKNVSSKKNNITDKKSQYKNYIENIKETKQKYDSGEINGITTGLYNLDNLMVSFDETSLNIIAARPAMGKTSLVLSISDNVLLRKGKNNVLFFSLEMPYNQLINKLLSIRTGYKLEKFIKGDFSEEELENVIKHTNELENHNLYIEDRATVNIIDIQNIVTKYLEDGVDINLIIIDYLQLVESVDPKKDRRLSIEEISRKLKLIAKDMKIPVIALSQLNRTLEQRNDKRPMLSDLRESGAIEQDADRVLFIYRDSVYNKKEEDEEKAEDISEIILAKNRNGKVGTAITLFEKERTLFKNADEKKIKEKIVKEIKDNNMSNSEEDELPEDIFDVSIF